MVLLIAVIVTGCSTTQTGRTEQLRITIAFPSDGQGQLIAPNRHFKVIADVDGGIIPDGSDVRVSLLDSDGNEVRYARSTNKGIGNVDHSWMTDSPLAFRYPDRDVTFADVAYLAPDFFVGKTNQISEQLS